MLFPENCARVIKGPEPQTPQTPELFRQPPSEQLNRKHELVLLGDAMDL
jgi:hypothetical protein